MLRWLVRASVAGSANSDVRSESDRASRMAKDAKRQFDYAKRERDMDKKLAYGSNGNQIAFLPFPTFHSYQN